MNRILQVVSLRLLALITIVHVVSAADYIKTWNIDIGKINSPQSDLGISFTDKTVLRVNQQFPPPPIEVTQGDTIKLTVNVIDPLITEGVTLHAHGFHQLYSNEEDGPHGVTQCPILPGETHTYEWKTTQCGTFWLHSHVIGQYPAGLRSPLIVKCLAKINKDDPDSDYGDPDPTSYGYSPEKEFTMFLNDHWNTDQKSVDKGYKDKSCCIPNSSQENCGVDPPPHAADVNDSLMSHVNFDARKGGWSTPGMRVRIINQSAFATFLIFATDFNLNLNVIEVDGVALKQAEPVKNLEVHPGQRYSLQIDPTESDGNPKDLTLIAAIDPARYAGSTCTLNVNSPSNKRWDYVKYAYATFQTGTQIPSAPSFSSPLATCGTKLCWYFDTSTGKGGWWNLPSHATNVTARFNDDLKYRSVSPREPELRVKWSDSDSVWYFVNLTESSDRFANMNNLVFQAPSVPVMVRDIQQLSMSQAVCAGFPRSDTPTSSLGTYYGANNIYYARQNQVVFLIVRSTLGAHPFHVHGTDFQILYHGKENVAQSDDLAQVVATIKRDGYDWPEYPLRRDTIHIGSKTYSIIAFKAKNPGSWIIHCHNDFHAQSGMAGVLVVHPTAGQTDWDLSKAGNKIFRQCRLTTNGSPPKTFDDWTHPCCIGAKFCLPNPALVRNENYWKTQA